MTSGRRAWVLTILLGMLLGPGLSLAQEAQQQPTITDDWLELEGKTKLFLPGTWQYEYTELDVGPKIEARAASGKLRLTLQLIEGKQEATAEKLQQIFEQTIATGAQRTAETAAQGLRGRYTGVVEGENTVYKTLFLRHGTTGYMVYMHALAADVQADAEIEKLMDSVLSSIQPL